MPGWVWFLIGLVLGTSLGVVAMAVCVAAKLSDIFDGI